MSSIRKRKGKEEANSREKGGEVQFRCKQAPSFLRNDLFPLLLAAWLDTVMGSNLF